MSTEDMKLDLKPLHDEISRLWSEISEIRDELKAKNEQDTLHDSDIKERLSILEVRFTNLQMTIVGKLEEYRIDHHHYLELQKKNLDNTWKLIFGLVVLIGGLVGVKAIF